MISMLTDDDVYKIATALVDCGKGNLANRLLAERRDMMQITHRALDLVGAGVALTLAGPAGPAPLALRRWNDTVLRFKVSVDAWKGDPTHPSGGKPA